MPTDRFKVMRLQHRLELFRRKIVRARGFDILDPIALHFRDRRRHVFRKLRPQAVQLQSNRPFKARPSANMLGPANDASRERDCQNKNDQIAFHARRFT